MNYKTSDLIKDLAEVAGSQIAAKAFITEAVNIITEKLAAGYTVNINDLGKFEPRLQKGRSGTVPGTTKQYSTQDKMVPSFKASKTLKDAVAKGK